MSGPQADLTELVREASAGDRRSLDALFDAVYHELKRLASSQRGRWEGDYTLSTTALVHEAYLKLVRQDEAGWNDRVHFMATASRAMRQILVNYAERRMAQKRGGGARRVELELASPLSPSVSEEVLALNSALGELSQMSPRRSRMVELRFFGGMTVAETAEALGISPSTVEREWRLAGAWLRKRLEGKALGEAT
jgi:RNA polymerase sigma factor (TIGR02999 family)